MMGFEHFMNMTELFERFRNFERNPAHSYSDRVRCKTLTDYLASIGMPDMPHYDTLQHLAKHIAEGIEDDARRPQHEKRLGIFSDNLSSLTELVSSGSEEMLRAEKIRSLTDLLQKITGIKELGPFLAAYWNAKYITLEQAADRFCKRVWQQGLCELEKNTSARTLRGTFGKTKLATNYVIGSVGVIFCRGWGSSRTTIHFIGEHGNPERLYPGSGPEATLSQALEMVEEVISRWPSDPRKQSRIMRPR